MSWPIIPNLPFIVLVCAGAALVGRVNARQSCDRVTCQVTKWSSRLLWPLAILLMIQAVWGEPQGQRHGDGRDAAIEPPRTDLTTP